MNLNWRSNIINLTAEEQSLLLDSIDMAKDTYNRLIRKAIIKNESNIKNMCEQEINRLVNLKNKMVEAK